MKKAEIRKYYLEKRRNLSSEDVELKSKQLAEDFFKTINLNDVKYLHVFIPIKKFNEVDTWPIICKIWNEYPHIKTVTSVTLESKLQHYIFNKDTEFIEDNWGIPIPQNCKKIDVIKIDLVITPLLAFDKKLNRVGYGKGYYDKFFSECKSTVQKIGISLLPPLDEGIEDIDQFDVALDKVLF